MIREEMKNLSPEQLSQLMYAFEHDISTHVTVLKGDTTYYIGVNIRGGDRYDRLEETGKWSFGRLK